MKCIVSSFLLCFVSLFGVEEIHLKTPDLSKENIIGMNVGIRPCRKNGVRLEKESIQDKCIIHNYGYGGSGLTLSFGGAKEVADLVTSHNPKSKTIAVLGAGVAGLTTAYDLMNLGFEVRIYSSNWSPNVTSNIGVGIWSPLTLPENAPEEKKQLNQRMLAHSEARFLQSTTDHPEFAGIRLIDSYSFKSANSPEAIKTKHRGEDVIVHLDNGVVKAGKKIKELSIDGKVFMEDLFAQVKAKGAILIQREFKSLDDVLSLEEETIINCTSFGSVELFKDEEFIPVRGQIIYFKPQEGVDFLMYQNVPDSTTSWVSIYPWNDRIILGGVYEKGEDQAILIQETVDKIIDNGQKCLSGDL